MQVAQDFQAVAINLELNSMPYAVWIQQFMAGTFETDLFSLAWNSAPYGAALRLLVNYSFAMKWQCHSSIVRIVI